MNRLIFLLVPVVSLAFIGCGPDEDENGDQYERPDEARSIITDAQLDSLVDLGATIYAGDTPPDLAGVYNRSSGTVVAADNEDSVGMNACTSIWTVEATDDEFVYSTTAEDTSSCGEPIESPASYLAGSDGCFSLYVENDADREGCSFRFAEVISGCVESDGIHDYQSATLGLENDGSEACDALIGDAVIPDEGERAILDFDFVARQ